MEKIQHLQIQWNSLQRKLRFDTVKRKHVRDFRLGSVIPFWQYETHITSQARVSLAHFHYMDAVGGPGRNVGIGNVGDPQEC